ncbi:hypothetical protein BH23CHL8_BH23CHL8_26130 [soil metagenome]
MRIDRGLLNWGVFLIVLGGVPLAVQQGWAGSGIAGDLWRLWPLILVGIGLGLILRWTPVAWLGGALVAATFGLIAGALITGGVSGISSACVGLGNGGETTSRSGAAAGLAFELEIELSCGTLSVSRETGSSWSVEALHSPDRPPTVEGDATGLSVRQDLDGGGFVVLGQQTRNEWQVRVPAGTPITASVTLNAADAELDFGAGPLNALAGTFNAVDVAIDLGGATSISTAQLALTFNAASGDVTLPSISLNGRATLNASSLTLCVPAAAALRVEHEGTFSSDNLGQVDLVQGGDGWQTEGYDTATARVDLGISSTVSSITLERPEVCS